MVALPGLFFLVLVSFSRSSGIHHSRSHSLIQSHAQRPELRGVDHEGLARGFERLAKYSSTYHGPPGFRTLERIVRLPLTTIFVVHGLLRLDLSRLRITEEVSSTGTLRSVRRYQSEDLKSSDVAGKRTSLIFRSQMIIHLSIATTCACRRLAGPVSHAGEAVREVEAEGGTWEQGTGQGEGGEGRKGE